ncbi:MAG: zinc-finger domain-containing protein, partial [Beijerinckiaceae bacterium]
MAGHAIPHLHNDEGHSVVHVGAKEFMCVGAKPPFDHPHVFLDMGGDHEIICPYCSTLYRFREDLHGDRTDPPGCLLT